MQLDKTEIIIRQRSAIELFDLSMLVLQRHWWRIMLTSAVFGLPLLVLNGWLTWWMLTEDAYMQMEYMDSPEVAMHWRHLFHNCLLFIMQFPLISLPTTIFLGNQIFFEPADWRSVMKKLKPVLWRCILVLGVFRLGLLCIAAECFVDRYLIWDWLVEFWILIVPCGVALFIRAAWPFAPEILGLELCKLRSKKKGQVSYPQRSRGLHRLVISDNIARHIGVSFFGTLLWTMIVLSILWVLGTAFGIWSWSWMSVHNRFTVPLALWLVGILVTVFRFLGYLDTRIRLEGWEVELRVKAEAARLQSSVKAPVSAVSADIEKAVQPTLPEVAGS